MSRKNLIIAIIFMLLSVLLLFAPQYSCEAAAVKEYTITAQELTTLEVELQLAQKAIQNCKSSSVELQKQLTASKEALAEAQLQLQALREQLEASQITLTQQKQQLQNANESLTALSKKMKEEQQSLKRQRDIAYIITAAALYVAAK